MPTIHDPATVRLGKAAPKHDPRTLALAEYLPEALPPVKPHGGSRTTVTDGWPMYGNDQWGDCVFAGAGHETQQWTAAQHREARVTDQDVLGAYSAVTGFDPNAGPPGQNPTDQGTVVLDALNYRCNTGIAGHRLGAFVAVEPRNVNHVKLGIDLFGAVGIGLALPVAAQNQRIWHLPQPSDPNGEPGSWGGHYVPAIYYDSAGVVFVTWGGLKRMTWGFWKKYTDEAYVLLSPEWLDATAKSPEGFDLHALQSDLQALKAVA